VAFVLLTVLAIASGAFAQMTSPGHPAPGSYSELGTQRLQIHEKTAWMLRSLLEDG